MKKGDVVIVTDRSWNVMVKNGKLVNSPRNIYKDLKCTVIETNCKFPQQSGQGWRCSSNHNNTVIQIIKTGEVVFIEQRFLQLTTHTLTIDGKSVTLSHESFENLKRQLV